MEDGRLSSAMKYPMWFLRACLVNTFYSMDWFSLLQMQVTCVSQAQLLESSLLEILLNRCIILVLFLRIAKIVALYQVLVQVLGAAGFVKVKGATTCTAVLWFVTTWQRALLASASASKWAQTQLRLALWVVGGARVSLSTSALVLDMVNGTGGCKEGKCGQREGFVFSIQCLCLFTAVLTVFRIRS